jgi:glycosyltransferase involved in cell wall biosynthesis
MIVEAFSRLGLPLLVVGEGQDFGRITRMAKSNVRLLGFQPDPIVQDLLGRARAFVMAASEDFGIAAVEAQAAGCPVIAYAKGGALETVIEGETGLYFAEQTVESLEAAVEEFVRQPDQFEASRIRRNAERFNRGRFQHELVALVEREWNRFGCQNHEDKASAFPIRHG